jgi:parallel beta-helix repeat protein
MKKVVGLIFSSIILLAAGQAQALDTSGLHSCTDVAAPTIAGPGPDGEKCHAAILKSVGKFLKTKVGTKGKCLAKNEPVLCPDAKGQSKIQKIALKSEASIAKACIDSTDQAALGGFYGGLADETIIGQCLLGQNAVLADLFLGITHGVPGNILKSSSEKCGKTATKSAVKFLTGISKATTKCLSKVAVDGATCVGSRVAGAWVDPSDAKAAKGYSKAREKLAKGINKKCSDIPGKQLAEGELGFLISMRSCPGTTTTQGLIDCLSCTGENTWLGILDQVYNESAAAIVAEGESLQAAVDSAATGDKILILSGTYEEEILISAVRKCSGGVDDGVACSTDGDCTPPGTCVVDHADPASRDGLALVGCGAATDSRPLLRRPTGVGPFANGIFAVEVDGLEFQSLVTENWDENGIFVSGAEGVTFRDVIGDGGTPPNSTYGIFPVQSNNVIVETSVGRNVADAGIYVGQSTNVVIRYCDAYNNPAGIELENSSYGVVQNNLTFDNSGGLAIFKLPDLPVQLVVDNDISYNVMVNNNIPNIGLGLVGNIPVGTGMLVISVQDTDFHHNLMENNNSAGVILLDQEATNVFAPGTFTSLSPDQALSGNTITYNVAAGNGAAPDLPLPSLAKDIIYAHAGDAGLNCFTANSFPTKFTDTADSGGFPACP